MSESSQRNERNERIVAHAMAFLAVVVLLAVLKVVLPNASSQEPSQLSAILIDGDSSSPITVHTFMWISLFAGFAELWVRLSAAVAEEKQLGRGYLSVGHEDLFDKSDLEEIGRRVRESKFKDKCFLPRLIRRVVDQYQLTERVDQATTILTSSVDNFLHELDLRYSVLRYIVWLIPSLGFIGTVLGIMLALQYAGVPANAEDDAFLYEVTTRLGVAFTTTLVALVMSSLLVLLQSIVQAREERALNQTSEYCLDHLINNFNSGRQQ